MWYLKHLFTCASVSSSNTPPPPMYQWGILLVPVVSPGPSEALWFWPTRIVASECSGKFISKHEKSFDYLCSRMTWDGRSKNERSLEQYRGIRTLYALLWPKLTIGSMPMLRPKKRTKLTAFFNFIVGHLTFCFQKLLMHAGLPRGGGGGEWALLKTTDT